MKEAGELSDASRLVGRPKGRAAAAGDRRDNSNLQRTTPSTSRADQRPGVLIVGSCHGKVFVADDPLIYAETLEGEEAVRAWLVEHDIHMARLEPTSGPFREPS
jgi:hypothetical protein